MLGFAACGLWVGLLSAAPLAAQAEPLTAAAAYRLVDAGSYAYRKHPAYTATAYQEQGRGLVTITEYARNGVEGRRLVRVERKAGGDLTIYLSNSQGRWIVKGANAARIAHVPELWQTMPLRFPTGLREANALVFSEDTGVEHFGLPVVRISIELAAGVLAMPAVSVLPEKSVEQKQPAKYEYLFDEKTKTLLAWRALSATGAKLGEIGYQEFTVGRLPDSLFELPGNVAIVAPESAEEMRRLFGPN